MAFGGLFSRRIVQPGRHRFQVGRHRTGVAAGRAGKHRVKGPWDTNFFSFNYKPRRAR